MDSIGHNSTRQQQRKTNQNIQVYVRVRPLNARERCIRSSEVIDVVPPREIITRHTLESKLTKKFTFDRAFGPESKQVDVYSTVVAPLIEEVLSGYNCTVFAYGQTGTGKTHTMVGNECAELKSSWEDDSEIGIIPRALSHLFDELRLMEVEYTMRISYLELYNEELCDLLSTDDTTKIRIFDDSTKKGSVIIQGLEEIPVHSKDDVYKLLEKGKERRKTATTLMNAQSSRSHTVFSILVHIRENGIDGEDMLKIGKLNLVDLAGSENVSKAGNEKGIRVRETVNINQSLLTLGRVITALVERTPHIPYRESKLTRLLQESLGGRTKTSIIATISPGHKDIEETLSTLEYAHRAKNIQNKPEVNQKLAKKTVLKEYTEEIDKLKRDLMAARDKNGIYLAEETYSELTLKMDSQNRELNEKMLLLKALKDELANKEKIFNEVSLSLVEKTEELKRTEKNLTNTQGTLLMTKQVLKKTKRRYKEKQVLIDSHVKTEKDLTTQASQILEVADLATSDTHKLHNTIERRKDVDNKIRTACESFTERMQDNFEMFEGNLCQFQKKHESATSMFDQELSKTTEVNNRLFSRCEKGIAHIQKVCLQSLALNNEFNIEFAEALTGLSQEHRDKLKRLFASLKSRESEMKSDILATIHELESNNDLQKTTIDTMHNIYAESFERNAQAISTHVREMQDQLANIASLAISNFEELAKLQTELDNEHALVNQEQTIIEDFMRKMEQIKELRLNNTQNMSQFLSRLQTNNKSAVTQVQQNIESGVQFEKQRQAERSTAASSMEQQVEAAILSIDESVAKCSQLQMQVDNMSQTISTEISNFDEVDNTYCTRAQELCIESTKKAKRMRLGDEEQVCKASADLQDIAKEERQRLQGHIVVAAVHVSEMKTNLTEYAELHKKHLEDASVNVAEFSKSELKTYSSTGATPSKRDFIYPRVLSATSPHQDIVRRFRQDQDWSDLDTTVAIDECSENEADPEPHSVQDFSQTEAMLNSTPVMLPEAQPTLGIANNTRSLNALKPSMSSKRSNNSLSRAITPQKSSPRRSPGVNRSNKENIA